MAKIPLKLESLAAIDDGRVKILYERLLAALVKDCNDRPGDLTARKLRLELNIAPAKEQSAGSIGDEVDVHVKLTTSCPAYRTREHVMQPRPSGELMFNAMDPQHPDQMTIDEEINRHGEED